MARSTGEAIGEGLESGLRIGFGIRDRERAARRQEEQDAFERQDRATRAEDRQLGLQDRQLALADRQRLLRRQTQADKGAALDAQLATVNQQLAGMPASAANTPEARALTTQAETLRQQKMRGLVDAGGYDFEADAREAAADVQALDAGQGETLGPRRLVRAVVAASRRPSGDFLRVNGGPSKIGAAADDFRAGLAGGDTARLLRGANVLMAPDLQRGIGEPSPHGGKIVGKEIVAFDQHPDSDPNDPQLVPRLRVWVAGKPKNEDEARQIAAWRAAHPGAPEGATGFYFAPVTEDRSSSPDAPVKTIGMRQGMQYLDGLRRMEDWLNKPEVATLVQQGEGEWDQQRFLAARAAAKPKGKAQVHALNPGASLAITDDDGNLIRRIDSPVPKTNPEVENARLALMAAQTSAAAALAGLRDRRGGGDDRKQRQLEARQALAQLVAQRVAVSSQVRDLVNEIKDASGARRKELTPMLDQARRDVEEITRQIGALNQGLQEDSSAAPPPAPGLPPPRENPAGSPPGKPAGSGKPSAAPAPNRIRMDAQGNVVR